MSRVFDTTLPFPTLARRELGDAQLRKNLAHATSTIREKRLRVIGELSDWEQLRDAGASIKDYVLDHMDELLVELERNVTRHGGVVHWARSGAEANAIVVDLVKATGESSVVKVKSMTTAEIELNVALERNGIAAYETDLAELIVQLGDDLPSHILVPAIHKNRSQIRKIFLDKMGEAGLAAPADLSDDPSELTAVARAHLRDRFLSAKVAISGANFLIADTGGLVVVESEGNGRMCLTLPETLISVVGVEKLLPDWRSLEVFLQLLPCSATGERMNPYTSIFTGVAGGDGPSNFHLVLLDNGRTSALAERDGRDVLRCIRCSACMNVCPVYERTGGHAYGNPYPGPIGAVLVPQLRRNVRTPLENSLPFASTLCGACYEACPVKINIPKILVRLFDYCQETDGACAVVVTSTDRARDTPQPSAIIRAVSQGTGSQPQVGTYFSSLVRESLTVQPSQSAAEMLYRRAGMGPSDINVAQFYDCFTPTVLLQLEDYGFCKKGEGGAFASSGALDLDGEIPINTAGGNLSEGYIHGMNHILEGVRQVRGTSTSQVVGAKTCLVTSGIPTTTSALILRAA